MVNKLLIVILIVLASCKHKSSDVFETQVAEARESYPIVKRFAIFYGTCTMVLTVPDSVLLLVDRPVIVDLYSPPNLTETFDYLPDQRIVFTLATKLVVHVEGPTQIAFLKK